MTGCNINERFAGVHAVSDKTQQTRGNNLRRCIIKMQMKNLYYLASSSLITGELVGEKKKTSKEDEVSK